LGLYSCGRGILDELFGQDIEYKLSKDYRIAFKNKDTLVFESAKNQDIFFVDSIINGHYYESITGTCGKDPFDVFEFQYVYIRKMTDTIRYYESSESNDCWGTPSNNKKCITYVKGVEDTYASDGIIVDSEINWYDVLDVRVSQHSNYFKSKKILNRTFYKVYEFKIENSNKESSITTFYYSHKYGFVGYVTKSGEIFELKK